jgi:hypothetical protein
MPGRTPSCWLVIASYHLVSHRCAHLFCFDRRFPLPVSALEYVFELVSPKSLFPTAADLLCLYVSNYEAEHLVKVLLRYGYTVSEVVCWFVCVLFFLGGCVYVCVCVVTCTSCVQHCLERLTGDLFSHGPKLSNFLWYALVFHRCISVIPPSLTGDIRAFVDECMADTAESRVAWAPHTHLLFPQRFQVCSHSSSCMC